MRVDSGPTLGDAARWAISVLLPSAMKLPQRSNGHLRRGTSKSSSSRRAVCPLDVLGQFERDAFTQMAAVVQLAGIVLNYG